MLKFTLGLLSNKDAFEPARAGLGYQWKTPFEWALAFPTKEKRKRALMKLFNLDRSIENWMSSYMERL